MPSTRFVECFETNDLFIRMFPTIGWGATIHDLVLELHVSRFKVHMLWIL
jgi:hypothetical protein